MQVPTMEQWRLGASSHRRVRRAGAAAAASPARDTSRSAAGRASTALGASAGEAPWPQAAEWTWGPGISMTLYLH
jgi:hypothetical protein